MLSCRQGRGRVRRATALRDLSVQHSLLRLAHGLLSWLWLRRVLVDLVGNPEIVDVALVVLADGAGVRVRHAWRHLATLKWLHVVGIVEQLLVLGSWRVHHALSSDIVGQARQFAQLSS